MGFGRFCLCFNLAWKLEVRFSCFCIESDITLIRLPFFIPQSVNIDGLPGFEILVLLIGQFFASECFWSFLWLVLLIVLLVVLGLTVVLALPVGIIAVKKELYITLISIELYRCRDSVPFVEIIPSNFSGLPSIKVCFCSSFSFTPLISSGIFMKSVRKAITSLVNLSMLIMDGISSPVLELVRLTTRPILPVSSRFFLSSSVNLCPKNSKCRLGSFLMPCIPTTTLPSSACCKDRRGIRAENSTTEVNANR